MYGAMRKALVLLVLIPLSLTSQNVFSVYDDILAFPQYEIIFSDSYILDTEAESRLAYAASSSSAKLKAAPLPEQEAQSPEDSAGELSWLRHGEHHGYGKAKEGDEFDETTDDYEPMMLNGKRYLCAIPVVETPVRDETSEAAARAEEEKELSRATERGWELLKDMQGHCMYFISGWWSYSFCYNSHVKQFHQLPPGKGAPIYPPTEDPTTPSYVLGRFSSSRDDPGEPEHMRAGISDGQGGLEVTELQAKGEMRYLVQKLGGGTTCDLTGKERKVEVQFHCHPQSADRIGWIKEISTCSYLMVIYTPRLCNDIAFLPPRETQAHPIACREVLSAQDVPTWQALKTGEAQLKLGAHNDKDHEHDHERPVVGGIEIGAMLQVGKAGRRIESSQVAGGANGPSGHGDGDGGVRIDIVAKGDDVANGGKTFRVSNEDLRNLGVNPETVDRLREELRELAGDKGWRLEVVDAPDGLHELRGIVDGDGDGDGEGEVEVAGEGGGSEEEYMEEL